MKILQIRAKGTALYTEGFNLSFHAVQRVEESHQDSVTKLFGNIYINNAEAFIGINASGKTTALRLISFSSLLLNASPLNAEYVPDVLAEEKKATFDIDFYSNNCIFHLQSEILRAKQADGNIRTNILSEKLWKKSATSKINKTNLLNFEEIKPERVRDNADEYLPDDVSIMIAVNKQLKDSIPVTDLVGLTNFNLFFPDSSAISSEILSLLDPTIEQIHIDNVNSKQIARLKFVNKDAIFIHDSAQFNFYLSSGTVKGIRVYSDAIRTLKTGGILIIDEIENHFNRELVAVLIRLFLNKKTNPAGAVIIFSTHYPELLDEIDRNDAVFICRNNGTLTADNLHSLLKRNDINKSEIYQSNFLGGTAPKYQAVLALQKSILKGMGS